MKLKSNSNKQGRPSRGFTLMEMMMVLGIVALLLGVGVPVMVGVFRDANLKKAEADLHTIETNLIRYQTRSNMFPTSAQGLDALVNAPTVAPIPRNWAQMSEASGIVDPWNNTYEYVYPPKYNVDKPDVFSKGADGQAGTADDVKNWES
ncbi:MAG: type II secretion system major pseudopilin GspG [Verrucomicrobiota bacterium]